jgi:putative ABC transport system permease protein
MSFVALRMLTGDRAKYFGLVFAIAFCSFLLESQTSIFANILKRTAQQVLDVTDAKVWVMDPKTEYWEQTKALKDTDLTRVRGVPGVAWAVRLFKGNPVARTLDGKFAVSFLIGLDDATLTGASRRMLTGSWERLREPDSLVVDKAGYVLLFPGEPFELGRTLEMNDHRVTIVGISDASAPFASLPVMHARYSEAVNFLGRERTQLSFVIARAAPGVSPEALTARITAQTGLRARTTTEFMWDCIGYYLRNTGIPVNFGITILVALVVGTVVAGQTFYLFTIDNLEQFGALKAIGVTNRRLVGMILLQALSVGALGFSLGTGMAATFFEVFQRQLPTRGIVLMWQSVGITGAHHAGGAGGEPAQHPAGAGAGAHRGVPLVSAERRDGLAVACRDVKKHFGAGDTRIDALRGVDFGARFGELTFLVGPSGCGKTTLISVIAGLLDRTGGDLVVFGQRRRERWHGSWPPRVGEPASPEQSPPGPQDRGALQEHRQGAESRGYERGTPPQLCSGISADAPAGGERDREVGEVQHGSRERAGRVGAVERRRQQVQDPVA